MKVAEHFAEIPPIHTAV